MSWSNNGNQGIVGGRPERLEGEVPAGFEQPHRMDATILPAVSM